MEPEPESKGGTASVMICHTSFGIDASTVELREVGEIDAAAISQLTQLVSLRTLIVNCSWFSTDGWRALLRCLRGASVTVLELSGCNLGPRHAVDLGEYVRDAGAGTKSLTLSNNFIFGSTLEYGGTFGDPVHDVDADGQGWSALCDSFAGSALATIVMVDIGMGAVGVTSLASSIPAIPHLQELILDSNLISATERVGWSYTKTTLDAELSGLTALCASLACSAVSRVSFKECWLGPQALALISDAIPKMVALNEFTLDRNPLSAADKAKLLSENIQISRARLRALEASKLLHDMVGEECAHHVDTDALHMHERLCRRLVLVGAPWFELAVKEVAVK